MKKISILLVLLAGSLAGCRNLGYNDHALPDSATPSITEKDYTRTYDANGNPVVAPTAVPATTDPASPNYYQH